MTRTLMTTMAAGLVAVGGLLTVGAGEAQAAGPRFGRAVYHHYRPAFAHHYPAHVHYRPVVHYVRPWVTYTTPVYTTPVYVAPTYVTAPAVPAQVQTPVVANPAG